MEKPQLQQQQQQQLLLLELFIRIKFARLLFCMYGERL